MVRKGSTRKKTKKIPTVLGEGTYGCVVKPSLRCDKGYDIKYHNTVSKIMDISDAADEYKEMNNIIAIKGIDRYILKKSQSCAPAITSHFRSTVRECRGKRIISNIEKPHRYRLLILEDGGTDLSNILKKVIQTMNFQDICRFLTSIRSLIEGVEFFRNNEIIHHDIKNENIVYNVENGEIKYIDFGLMMWRHDFIQRSTTDSNNMAIKWFNFPTESDCLNRETFHNNDLCKKHRDKIKYNQFIKKAVDTFDVYSLALVIYDIARKIRSVPEFKKNLRDGVDVFYEEIKQVISPFYAEDITVRETRIQRLHAGYDALLRKFNILDETKPTPSQKTTSSYRSVPQSFLRTIRKSGSKSRTRKYSKTNSRKKCSQNKTINPITNRCVKRCDPLRTRNKHFRCVTRKQRKN